MYCRKCGNEIPDEAKFCPKCGKPISNFDHLNGSVAQNQPDEEKDEKKLAVKDKDQKHTKRSALIAIVVCAAAVVMLVIILPRVINTTTTVWVISSETQYRADSSEVYRYIKYIYDDDHLLTSITEYNKPGGRMTGDREIYTYDENGNLIKMVKSSYTGSVTTTEYTYDENGNLALEVLTYPDNGNEKYTEYTYDDEGNLALEVITESDYPSVYTYEYTYDDNGNNVSILHTSPLDPGTRYEMTYDDNGNMLTKAAIETSGYVRELDEYTYDDNGNLISRVDTYYNTSEIYYNEYTNDENGNVISMISTHPDGSTQLYEYTYESYKAPAEKKSIQERIAERKSARNSSSENTSTQNAFTEEAMSEEKTEDEYPENSAEHAALMAAQAVMEGDFDTYFSLLVPFYVDYYYEMYGYGDAESTLKSRMMNDQAELLPSENAVVSNYKIESISDLSESELNLFLDEDAGYLYGPTALNTQSAATVEVNTTVTDSGADSEITLICYCVEYGGQWYIYPPGF